MACDREVPVDCVRVACTLEKGPMILADHQAGRSEATLARPLRADRSRKAASLSNGGRDGRRAAPVAREIYGFSPENVIGVAPLTSPMRALSLT